jgi:benzoyl-CoA reductase/2-hydroxyglutaryl-CoA dehydratase subunit BcrC/BadD/HgdB
MAHPTRLFHTEDDLLKVWNDYKDDLEERSKEWEKVQYVGKDGERVVDHMKVPLTFEGFKRYCWDNKIGCIEQYFTNQDNCYTDFIGVCSRIKTEIRENQIIGGLMGVWNPSITQRLNGLADKSEIDLKTEPRIFNID